MANQKTKQEIINLIELKLNDNPGIEITGEDVQEITLAILEDAYNYNSVKDVTYTNSILTITFTDDTTKDYTIQGASGNYVINGENVNGVNIQSQRNIDLIGSSMTLVSDNYLNLETSNGNISLSANGVENINKNIYLSSGNVIEITASEDTMIKGISGNINMDALNGEVAINARDFTVNSEGIEMRTTGSFDMNAQGGDLHLNSNGTTVINSIDNISVKSDNIVYLEGDSIDIYSNNNSLELTSTNGIINIQSGDDLNLNSNGSTIINTGNEFTLSSESIEFNTNENISISTSRGICTITGRDGIELVSPNPINLSSTDDEGGISIGSNSYLNLRSNNDILLDASAGLTLLSNSMNFRSDADISLESSSGDINIRAQESSVAITAKRFSLSVEGAGIHSIDNLNLSSQNGDITLTTNNIELDTNGNGKAYYNGNELLSINNDGSIKLPSNNFSLLLENLSNKNTGIFTADQDKSLYFTSNGTMGFDVESDIVMESAGFDLITSLGSINIKAAINKDINLNTSGQGKAYLNDKEILGYDTSDNEVQLPTTSGIARLFADGGDTLRLGTERVSNSYIDITPINQEININGNVTIEGDDIKILSNSERASLLAEGSDVLYSFDRMTGELKTVTKEDLKAWLGIQ